MLAGVWLIYTSFGMAVFSNAPLVGPMTRDLDMSLGAMGTVMGAWPLVYIAMAVPAGALLDRFGVRPCLLVAALLMSASVALRAAADGFFMLFVAVGLFGIGGPLVSVGAPKLISLWFEGKERGLAIGIYSTGPTIGAICVLSLTNSVLMPSTGYSWRLTLLVYAAITALAGLVWLLVSNHRDAPARDTHGAQRSSLRSQLQVFFKLLALQPVRIVLGVAVGMFMFNHTFNNWLPEMLSRGGMEPVAAGFWAAVPSVVGTAAALMLPRLAVPGRRISMLVSGLLLAAFAVLLIAFATGPWLALGLLLQGVARGAMIPIAMLTLMEADEVDTKVMGAAGGLFFTAAETGGVMGPMMTGWLADATGGFATGLVALSIVCVLCAVLVTRLRSTLRRT